MVPARMRTFMISLTLSRNWMLPLTLAGGYLEVDQFPAAFRLHAEADPNLCFNVLVDVAIAVAISVAIRLAPLAVAATGPVSQPP